MISNEPTHPLMSLASPELLITLGIAGFAQSIQTGRLDFLKSKDSSVALFANTSTTTTLQTGKRYPNELLLLTGLPSSPTVPTRIELLAATRPVSGYDLVQDGKRIGPLERVLDSSNWRLPCR